MSSIKIRDNGSGGEGGAAPETGHESTAIVATATSKALNGRPPGSEDSPMAIPTTMVTTTTAGPSTWKADFLTRCRVSAATFGWT